MKCSNFFTNIGGLVVLLVSANTLAAPNTEDWLKFNHSAITQHIIPSYEKLAQKSQTLAMSIQQYCETPNAAQLVNTQQRFVDAMQAWQEVSHIQFGPVTLLMRNFSMQYWPDKKNLGGRQLQSMLDGAPQTYDEDYFAAASVAVKGLPALEKMLFSQAENAAFKSNDNFCPLLIAVSAHVSSNSRAIAAEWRAEIASFETFGEDLTYESATEAATEILKALVEPVEAIADSKLKAPLGSQQTKMRWRKSESWRSGQSIANIRSNIQSLHHLYSGVGQYGVKALLEANAAGELATSIDKKFTELNDLLAQVKPPVKMQYSEREYLALLAIEEKLKRLSDDLLAAMKPLDIQLGFNRRDGD